MLDMVFNKMSQSERKYQRKERELKNYLSRNNMIFVWVSNAFLFSLFSFFSFFFFFFLFFFPKLYSLSQKLFSLFLRSSLFLSTLTFILSSYGENKIKTKIIVYGESSTWGGLLIMDYGGSWWWVITTMWLF